MIRTLDRIARELWAYHYRIPEIGFWIAAGLAVLVTFFAPLHGDAAVALIFVWILAAVGIFRWKLAKKRCRFSMLVPRFEEGAGAQGRGAEAQTLVIDHLRRHLPEPLRSLVQSLPVDIGPADDAVAARLRRQLRAFYVLHGRVTARGDDWSVYPRVLEAASDTVTHMDLFTRDSTPANPRFGPFVSSLPPTVNVRDEEFPLDFCQDLEAVIQGLAGMAFASVGEHSAAIRALDRALEKAGQSTNHQIDSLRAKRAFSLHRLGQTDEGISYLRDRLRLPDPSPYLLRAIAHLLSDRAWSHNSVNEEADLASIHQ